MILEDGASTTVPAEPLWLMAGEADVFLALPERDGQPRRFLGTLAAPAVLVAPTDQRSTARWSLILIARGRTELVSQMPEPAVAEAAIATWLGALGADHGVDLLAASARRLDALADGLAELLRHRGERTGRRWHGMDAAFRASLGDFGRMLEGRFARAPAIAQPLPAIVRAAQPIARDVLGKAPPEFRAGESEEPLDALARFAAVCGLRLRRVRLEGDWTEAPPGPVLAFLEAAPVALLPSRLGAYEVEDPEQPGVRRRLTHAMAEAIEPAAFALQPTLPSGKVTYRDVMRFGLRHARWNIVELAVWGALIGLIGLAPPLGFALVTSHVTPAHDWAMLAAVVGAMLLALGTLGALRYASAIAQLRMEGRVGLLLHGAMIDRALRLPAQALRASAPVILATQLETVERFRRALTHYLIEASVALMSALFAAILLMIYVPRSGSIMLVAVAALIAVTAVIGWRQFQAIYEGERMDVIVLAFVYELIRLVPTLRAFGAERLAFVQWAQNFLAFQSRLLRSARITALAGVIEAGWELPTLALGFLMLALEGHGGVTAGVAVAFVVALGRLMGAGRELAHTALGIAKLLPMAKLARSFIDHELEPAGAQLPMAPLEGAIELADVGFGYGATPVLSGVSLRIAAGENVAIVGPSGSGKSTLLRLILGLDRPRAGTVLIDGRDMALLDPRQLRRQIGTVLQTSQLFPGTIFENIRGATDITLDEAWQAARLADVAGDIQAFPMDMRTRVAEGGGGLSGGQIQRLLLARALASRPAILVLDEATSALDSRSQARIIDAIAQLAPTRISVAHRFTTLRRCDRIFVLDRGRLVDEGNFEELAGREGLFRELMLRQAGERTETKP